MVPWQPPRTLEQMTKYLSVSKRLTGTDGIVPPAGLAGFRADAGGVGVAREGVKNQNGVGFGGVQLAVGLVGDGNWGEGSAAIERDGCKLGSLRLDGHGREFL